MKNDVDEELPGGTFASHASHTRPGPGWGTTTHLHTGDQHTSKIATTRLAWHTHTANSVHTLRTPQVNESNA